MFYDCVFIVKQIAKFVISHTGVGEGFIAKLKRLYQLKKHGEEYVTELIETRCERGADIAIRLGFNEAIADGVRYLDEHWNGQGEPYKRVAHEILVASQIALLAQVADVFFISGSKDLSLSQIEQRAGSWFDPELVKIFLSLSTNADFWFKLGQGNLQHEISLLEPSAYAMNVTE